MEAYYPIRAVAKLTGLSIDTLRAWERRYSAVVPERSDRGRQYTQEHIQRLILLRELVERGHAIGQIAGLHKAGLQELLSARSPVAEPPKESARELLEPLLEHFVNFEHTRGNEELGRLAALLAPRDLIYRVVLPLMREVGERWHRGEIGVAQEHLVSAALRNVFGALVRLHPPRPGAPKMLIATLSGELHEFGILAAAMLASIAGLDPIYLGPNLPAGELAYAARKTSGEIVLIGYSSLQEPSSQELAELIRDLPQGTELWVGGRDVPQPDGTTPRIPISSFPVIEDFEAQCVRRSQGLQA